MGELSYVAANAIVWPTYAVMLMVASVLAYRLRNVRTFLSANGTQKAVPLALNFIASGLGCGVLLAYPQMANVAGLQGLLVYVLTSALPMYVFAFFGPLIKQTCPDGFVLTEWVLRRFGRVAALYLSACTMLTLYLFMVSEIVSLRLAVEALSNIKPIPVVIVQCVVTTIYTAIGGFHISFVTDSLQATVVLLLLIVCAAAVGTSVKVDPARIGPSGLLRPSRLGWQLVYILTIAIFTNDFFMSGFWLRTFAARSNRDLLIGCSLAAALLAIVLLLIGVTGLLAVWAGYAPVADAESASFFLLIAELPAWVNGVVLAFVVVLSTCTLDSFQSALVSTVSNDLFRNRLRPIYARAAVAVVMVPVVVVGLLATDILAIYLIVDLLSAAVVPVMLLGFWPRFARMSAYEVIGGGLGGLLCVFIFGAIYYHSAREGGRLLIIANGLYADDWGTFGAMVAAPVGSLLFAGIIFLVRSAILRARPGLLKVRSRADSDKPFALSPRTSLT
ncbi:AaceriAGR155Cp [[Ashbya] aceris (nom. inval.)]|nr:AaceriAGR155Cp [[Ashbya] aceris (nom. inval.)]